MKSSRWPVASSALLAAACLAVSLAATAQTRSVAPRVTEAVDLDKLVTLRGNVHPLARPEYDRGAVTDSQSMRRMLLVLQRGTDQEAALRQLLDDQQTKSSPNYHKWLTPQEFGMQFGPADADVQAVTDWLTQQGFQVARVTAGRTVIEFSGTAGQVRQALHTEIHRFEVNGEERLANVSDPQIPAALSPVIDSIVSLNNFPRKTFLRRLGTFSRSKETGEVRPLFTFTQFGQSNFAVGPSDFAKIYNVQSLWDAGITGTGQTIAVVADSNINIQDARDFRSIFGLPANDPVIVLDGPDPGLNSYTEGEADLDVEWAGAVAKNATIKLVISADTETSFGADLSALYIVDNNVAPVLTDSFGSCEGALGNGGNALYSAVWEQAAAQGITVLAAAGDSGSAECDDPNTENAAKFGLAVSGIASTPFNVSIGGTDFNDLSNSSTYWSTTNASGTQLSAKSYIPEIPWNDSCTRLLTTASGCSSVSSNGQDLVGGGGGPSSIYAQPSWQSGTGTGVPADGKRHSPDVSLFSGDDLNGSFYLYCQSDANTGTGSSNTSCDLNSPFLDFQGAGGTSFASPAFAGIMALVNQKTGARQGNANYVLYPLAATSGASCTSSAAAVTNSSCIFYDVATGNNSVACMGGTPNCSNSSHASGQFGALVSPSGSTSLAWPSITGYDMATGLGTVNAANLVNNWASASFSSTSTTLVSISPNPAVHGKPVTVTVNVTSGAGTPTGDVDLKGTGGTLGIPPLPLSGGTFSGTTTFLPGGTYNVMAHYVGDGKFGASDSPSPGISVTVTPESSKLALGMVTFDVNTGQVLSTNATTAAFGSPYVLRADVTNGSGQSCSPTSLSVVYPCPSGNVHLTDNGAALDGGTFLINPQGYAEDYLIQLPASATPHVIVGTYNGDAGYSASTPVTDIITITQASDSLSLSSSATSVQVNATVTLSVNLTTQSNGDAPSGTVTFFNGATPIAGAVSYVRTPYSNTTGAYASLQASLTTSFSTVATDTITAQFGSDTNYASATSAPVTITVNAAPPDFTFTASPTTFNIASPGQSGTTTLTVSPTNGFTGGVSFTCAVPATMKEAACSLAPTSLTTTGTTTLTVTTTAPHTVGSLFRLPSGWLPYGGGLVLVCLVLLGIPTKQRRLKLALGFMAVCLVAAIAAGCGGGGSGGGGPTTDPGTSTGMYSITVTATSGSASHITTVTANVL